MTENLPISGIPILIFLCICKTASSPVSLSYFSLNMLKKASKKQPWGKMYKMCL